MTRLCVGPKDHPLELASTSQAEVRFGFSPQPWGLCLSSSSLSLLLDGFLRAQRGSAWPMAPRRDGEMGRCPPGPGGAQGYCMM